ncbi:MAG: ROK family protein [bacterium]|nr:ROK family protein [bacterium]
MNLLAIDFGGTRTRAAWCQAEPGGEPVLIHRDEMPTHAHESSQVVIDRLIALAQGVIPPGARPDAVGISAPGPHDAKTGRIYHSYALPGWHDIPLGGILHRAFGAPVYMENDGNLGAVAEYTGGAGRGCTPMLYLTISTGIGGGLMIDGRLYTGWSGLAIEPGHMVVTAPEGDPVRLEAIASGTGIAARTRRLLATTDQPSALRHMPHIDSAAVGQAALGGDMLALSVIHTAAHALSVGMVTLVHLFSPQAIVIGGSVTRLGNLLFDPVREFIDDHALDARFIPPDLIRLAQYGDDVCLIGAAMWAARGGM